jgi:hypothetical protein
VNNQGRMVHFVLPALLGCLLVIGMLAGCSTEEDRARAVVERWQELVRSHKYERAYELLDPVLVFQRFREFNDFKLWIVMSDNRGELDRFTRTDFHSLRQTGETTFEVYVRYPRTGRYTLFTVNKNGGVWLIEDIETELMTPGY